MSKHIKKVIIRMLDLISYIILCPAIAFSCYIFHIESRIFILLFSRFYTL